MYDIIDLNSRKVAELRDIAKELNIARTDKLKKQELVYAILDEQAVTTSAKAKTEGEGTKKEDGKKPANSGRGRQRAAAKKEQSSGEEGSAEQPSSEERGKDRQEKNSEDGGRKGRNQSRGNRQKEGENDSSEKCVCVCVCVSNTLRAASVGSPACLNCSSS